MKWVGTPMSLRFWKTNSEIRLFRTPFAVDHLVLLGIKGRCVILEVLDQSTRLGALIEDLCLAFVNAPAAIHWD